MNAAMILLFVLAAALQYNGDNPMIWIAVYGAAAILCVLFATGKFPSIVASVFAAGCLIFSLVLFWRLLTSDYLSKQAVFSQAAGLFVAFLWISTLAWTQQRERSSIT